MLTNSICCSSHVGGQTCRIWRILIKDSGLLCHPHSQWNWEITFMVKNILNLQNSKVILVYSKLLFSLNFPKAQKLICFRFKMEAQNSHWFNWIHNNNFHFFNIFASFMINITKDLMETCINKNDCVSSHLQAPNWMSCQDCYCKFNCI